MLNKKTRLIALLAGVSAGGVMAGDLTSYTTGDVLVCFRNGGQNDMVVDAGPIATLTNLTANTRYTIAGYTGTQLSNISTNSLDWSAFTWLSDDTLFVTRARSSVNTQSAPWVEHSATSQSGVVNRMATIPKGALDELNASYNADSTSTAVIEGDVSAGDPDYITGVSYHDALFGSYGSATFDGYFQGSPESTTPSNFTKAGTVQRADFYQLSPNSVPVNGTYVGYFELNTNGVLSYVAYPSTTPVLKSISRSGNSTLINYTAGVYGTYTLRETNSAGLTAAFLTWPAVTTLTSGDTAVHSATDTTTDTNRFYVITAQ